MARDMSPITIMGNLTETGVVRQTRRGQNVLNWRIAVNHAPDSQGNVRPSDFFDVTIWGPLPGRDKMDFDMTANLGHLPKGTRVFVIGRYRSDTNTGSDGQVYHNFSIVADDAGPSGKFTAVFAQPTPKRQTQQLQPASGPLDLSNLDNEDDF